MTPTLEQRLAVRDKPREAPRMYQRWRDLLFLHWHRDPAEIQATLPEGLTVDTYDGMAWIAIVPFKMRGVRLRFLPPFPGVSDFLELNVRTYAYDRDGIPGVWFYSLDADSRLAVAVARRLFGLNYVLARMSASAGAPFAYASSREGVETAFRWQPSGLSRVADPGGLDFFLLERYVLFTVRRGELRRGRVHHPPYRFAPAQVDRWDDHMLHPNRLASSWRAADHVASSPGVDVTVYGLERVGG